MNVKFLGTSHGVPMPGRFNQSLLITTEKGDYLVDAGAPVMSLLINDRYDMTRLKAVFITHVHQDHMVNLPDIISLASWYHKEMRFGVYLPEQRAIDAVINFCTAVYTAPSDAISFHLVREGCFFDDGNLKITAVHTDHLEATTNVAYGFLLEGEGQRFYITGDMNSSLKDFPSALLRRHVDLIVAECAHFSVEALMEKLAAVNTDRAVVLHVFPGEKYEKLRQYQGTLPFELLLPDDGDVI